jgi:hypothetical protein
MWSVIYQAYAGMLWSKQFFYYVVKGWLEGCHYFLWFADVTRGSIPADPASITQRRTQF